MLVLARRTSSDKRKDRNQIGTGTQENETLKDFTANAHQFLL